ncbi:DUF1538 domain-containing protein [Bacillus lacus]|uniref:DUF1538 domain-containing protein n=1 Tax=Metabacillus lacus TaxID=1983721 RepID=A0A7X2IY68_9BACI|nr:DUF1538 domain-containing protein [Metabacillus lacus]MRX71986.1 DUF1538 domain-containing protein [Metabacillus lacus]
MEVKIFEGFTDILMEVAFAVTPLLFFFLVFQIFFLKLPKEQIARIAFGFVFTYIGLALFLQGVHIGFMPVGREMGQIMGQLPYTWIIVPIGFVLGFVATFAEPAVRVLNKKIESVSSGNLSQRVMLISLSVGVGFSIALSMFRILAGIPLFYILIPGYTAALILLYFTNKNFIEIAFDSGGVATGPMTVTFILSIAVGVAAVTEGRDPLMDGFGMIALVALAPIISVLILGIIMDKKGIKNLGESEN